MYTLLITVSSLIHYDNFNTRRWDYDKLRPYSPAVFYAIKFLSHDALTNLKFLEKARYPPCIVLKFVSLRCCCRIFIFCYKYNSRDLNYIFINVMSSRYNSNFLRCFIQCLVLLYRICTTGSYFVSPRRYFSSIGAVWSFPLNKFLHSLH
jgi:hypothetical protein